MNAVISTCDPVWFNAAWYISLGIGYFHLFALFTMLLIQSPRIKPVNSFAGYFINIIIVFLLWHTWLRQSFSCQVGSIVSKEGETSVNITTPATHTHNNSVSFGQHTNKAHQMVAFTYTNALAFPSLDATLIAHLLTEIWDRWRDVLNRRHWVFLSSGLVVALSSMLWFHKWWHITLSLLFGAIIYLSWRFILIRYQRYLPRTCRPPPMTAIGYGSDTNAGISMATHHISRSPSRESLPL